MQKMRKFNKAITMGIAMVLAFEFLCLATTEPVGATVYNVTVKWTIPNDLTLNIGYVTGKGEIDFTSMSAKNFTQTGADSQVTTPGSVVYAINITNEGNVAIYIKANFTSNGMASGVTSFNFTTATTNYHMWYWATGNVSSQQYVGQTTKATLASGSHIGLFAFTSGSSATAGTTTKLLKIESSTT